ncbi:non-ribosomal peptide synthetase [Sphingobacterium lactis]|uniref:non-ribosomal peptide synthetase n=1 Tax=Sphingobacterium TaxID=28453 RepID=UPI0021A4238B|nr:non-ribosomal peptide synthetase [Sphingobacterium hotanense]MCT1526774.1 amino acid adenylation domain-containing protein [Sphingobacterium hotanense]
MKDILLTSQTLADSLKRAAMSSNKITFVKGGDDSYSISYSNFYQQVLQILAVLERLEIAEKSEIVVIVNDNELFLKLFWACILKKIIVIPVAPGSQEQHKEKVWKILQQLSEPSIVADDIFFQSFDSFLHANEYTSQIPIKRIDSSILYEPEIIDKVHLPTIFKDDIAYIQYSSGSTGDPKGVVLTHANLLSNTEAIAFRLSITQRDVALAWLPLTHDMGMICFHLTSVVVGCDQVIIPTTLFIRRPLIWLDLATRLNASILYSPNFGLQYLMKSIESNNDPTNWKLAHVRVIVNGAEPISETITKNFFNLLEHYDLKQDTMFPGYGLAEASVAVTLPKVGDELSFVYCKRNRLNVNDRIILGKEGDLDCLSFADCGYPVNDCRVRIVNDAGNLLPSMFVGHIQVSGKNVTQGYYKQRSSELFTSDHWLRTGDIGFEIEGRLFITGREKNIIIVNGQNYYPHDIEQLIEQELDYRPGSIVAIGLTPSEALGQIAVFVLFKGGISSFVDESERVKELLAARMDIYPDYVLPIRNIPKTTSGKVMHFRLKEELINGTFNREIENIQNFLQKNIQQDRTKNISDLLQFLFKKLGMNSNIMPDDNLFHSGLSSLRALSLINALAEYKYDISFPMLYENGTPRLLELLLNNQKVLSEDTNPIIYKSRYQSSYPLSWGQKQIYVAHMMAPTSANLNITFAVEMFGDLQEQLLHDAFFILMQRHDVLRTAIQWKGNEPLQIVYPIDQLELSWTVEDLTIKEEPTQELEKQKWRYSRMPFNLEEAPLYRLYLAKVANNKWVLLFSIHHIICDGWSIQIIGKELDKIYRALKAGTKCELTDSDKIQYKDFVFWQEQLQLTKKYQESKLFWEEYLSNAFFNIRIPYSNGKNAALEKGIVKGAVFKKYYSAELKDSITRFSQTQEVSFFSVVISSIALLVDKYNYDNKEDIQIGIDTAGRTHRQLEDQIGYFLNVLPLSIKLGVFERYVDLLKGINYDLLQMYSHQAYNIGGIDGFAQKHTDFSTYNVLVVFQSFEDVLGFSADFADLECQTEEIDNETCLNDILFEFSMSEGNLCLKVKYNTALYDMIYISNLCDHLGYILRQVCQEPDILINNISMLSSDERERILLKFSQTSSVSLEPKVDVIRLFECQAKLRPNAPALICGDEVITYSELNYYANQVALEVSQAIGNSPHNFIGIATERNKWLVIGVLGILKAGGAYVPIEPEYPQERIQYILDDCGLPIVLTDGSVSGFGDKSRFVQLADINLQVVADLPKYVASFSTTAYVIYTSGSTGHPKGVVVSRGSLANYVQAFINYFNINTEDKVVLQSSIAFDTMVEELFPVLCQGGTLVPAVSGGRNIEALSELIIEERITILSVTPLILNELNIRLCLPNSLRIIISGGDELLPSYINRLIDHVSIFNTYGPTETTVCATYCSVTDITKTPYIGRPIVNAQVYILDHALQLQPIGVLGEICIAGAGLAKGYLNRADLTKERFVSNPFGTGLMYRTGDVARWDTEGNISFFGRIDTQVKVRGYRIELAEIEKCLIDSKLVEQVAVDVFRENDEKTLIAYCTGKKCDSNVLREYLHSHLPYYMVPSLYIELSQLPITSNGKLDRKLLPRPEISVREYYPPQTYMEQSLSRIWEDILMRPRISMDDNFFEIGGQSLKAIQLISRVFKEFSVKLELRDLFSNPVFAQFTERVEMLIWINTPSDPDLPNNIDEIII